MHTLRTLLRRLRPSQETFGAIFRTFSFREWIVFFILSVVMVGSVIAIVIQLNNKLLVSVPTSGGSFIEGMVGTPRFINPVLSVSSTDRDMSALIYSGLVRKNENGNIEPVLSESYDVSDDGLIYTFHLRPGIVFHDGRPITADDVIFTINKIKDPMIKSPLEVAWQGVNVEKIDEQTVEFTLKQRFASFLENTSVGILPKHIWGELRPEEFNLSAENSKPIGSGPYLIKKMKKNSENIPTEYTLSAFDDFALNKPFIERIKIKFFSNEENLFQAYMKKTIDSAWGLSANKAESVNKDELKTGTLPRVFGIFFNQSKNKILGDKTVVSALENAIDKERIINEVLFGFGEKTTSPIPKQFIEKSTNEVAEDRNEKIALAEKSLEKAGWKKNENGIYEKTANAKTKTEGAVLAFSLTTSDTPELKRSAEIVKENLEAFGAIVELKVFEVGTLNQSIIRPREYEALLFGEIINHKTDLFAFWHSSQRNDPGLNISLYANPRVDTYLEDASGTLDEEKQQKLYTSFEQEIKKDMPAIFLYNPLFIYGVDKKIKGLTLKSVTDPSERFQNIEKWYIKTEHVWKIFAR